MKRAQVTTELLLVVTLAAAAVVVTGMYVRNSWNAHMKSYEDTVEDSFFDPQFEE